MRAPAPAWVASCAVLAAGGGAARAADVRFFELRGASAFLEGRLDGLALDSEGRLRLAPAWRARADPRAEQVWCLARDARGALYAGTGGAGRVVRVEGAQARVVFEAPELEVHALAVGPDGRVYAGTSPEGQVYVLDAEGRAEPFYKPGDRYIWALAFDRAGALLVATGDPGRLHRVDGNGRGSVLLSGPETHLTTLALDDAGDVYAGSSPGGLVYRIDARGRAQVLYDSDYREVKALGMGAGGEVYAVVLEGSDQAGAAPVAGVAAPALGTPALTEAALSEAFRMFPPGISPLATAPASTPSATGPARVAGALLRLSPTGEAETLWSSPDETPYALVVDRDGALVGTGAKGHLYRVGTDGVATLLSALPAEQVTALLPAPDGELDVGGSNPGRLDTLAARSGTRGTFESAPLDARAPATFGRLSWEARTSAGTTVSVQTRRGNAALPDATWSEWSAPLTRADGEALGGPDARFLQIRLILEGRDGRSPLVSGVAAAYLQRNLRPQIRSTTVHPPGEVFQKAFAFASDTEIVGFEGRLPPDSRGAPAPASVPSWLTGFNRTLHRQGLRTLTWKASDPNGDALVYDVDYRALGDSRPRPLRQGLTEPVLAWDTATLPDGRYVVRVTASDAPSNPGRALSVQRESEPFEVDNTPPVLQLELGHRSPRVVRARAHDAGSRVRRAEYALDAGPWQELVPLDGLDDAPDEAYEIPLDAASASAPRRIVVRVTDALGNVATARLEVP